MSNTECPICLNAIETTNCCVTECGHQFHSSCIFKNFQNSITCPLCRKELVEHEEEDEESEWETDSENSNEESDSESESDSDSDSHSLDGNRDKQKLCIRQVKEALKKKGYTETDFISFILSDYYDRKVNISQEIEDRTQEMIETIDKICFHNEIEVDYRDSRSYSSVLQGIKRNEEPGLGPTPVTYL